jgi:hypothetical protein
MAFFTNTVRKNQTSIKFAHQSLFSPRLPTFLKAVQGGYLKGCPNLTTASVAKFLNPSPATAKGHIKHPHQGI